MNRETETLKDRLSEIRDILLELEFLKKDILSLINAKKEHHQQVLSKSRFFYRLHLNYIKLFIIDIYKITGKKEYFNLGKVIEFCKINHRRIEWHHPISQEKLSHLSEELNKISEKFDQIKTLRNTHYAHNDKNKKKFITKLSLKELWDILDGLQDIFSRLNVDFDNRHWIFKIQYSSPSVVPNLFKYGQLHDLIYNEFEKNNSAIEVDKLLKIIFKN